MDVEEIKKYEEINKIYGVSREFNDDDCEYEVTKKAMLSYLKYPCYEKWIPFLYGGTREQFLNYERVLKNEYRGDKNYKGAFLLRNKENTQVLTADILTEIKSPIKKLNKIAKKCQRVERKSLKKYWLGP